MEDDPKEIFAKALQLHQTGGLAEAGRLYRDVLKITPGHADCLNLLGLVEYQAGRHDSALDLISRAIAERPGIPSYHSNLGNALLGLGRLDDAIASYQMALAMNPNHAGAHNNLGNVLKKQGKLDEAGASFREALRLNPNATDAHMNLGRVLHSQGLLAEATFCYQRYLELVPDHPDACFYLAETSQQLDRFEEATAYYKRFLALKPNSAAAWVGLGLVLHKLGQLDEEIACYREAQRIDPDLVAAHGNECFTLLMSGNFKEGWKKFEWRWRLRDLPDFKKPQWYGEDAKGKTVLIHAEQGFGDTLQFCRLAALASSRGLNVIMGVQKPLARLLNGLAGVDLLVTDGQDLPAFDYHCPMLSLPLALGLTLETIPATCPYLEADPNQVAAWQARLPIHGVRVGLVWAGNPYRELPSQAETDRRRSMDPQRLAPLFDLEGFQFFSLQKDRSKILPDLPLIDHMEEMEDFADTAALIANLDLIISVDTAVAHLAAALGKPVWLLNRFDSCWRWLWGREDSPWYPTMRIFQQSRAGDWEEVISRVVDALPEFAQARKMTEVAGFVWTELRVG